MIYLTKIFENFLLLANAMSIYILIGLLIAAILKELLPDDFISRHLGANDYKSVIKATLLGIPMPVCSCSVVPLAKSLQKEGASKGSIQSFLISTPITGVDSILATYSFFGWFFTIYRVITSTFIAIVTGIIQNIYDQKESKTKSKKIIFSTSCCDSKGCCNSTTKQSKFNIKNIFVYAFDTLFSDMAKSLLFGLILGAIITTFLPKELLETLSSNHFISYVMILIISMPLYVCATSSLPIGASLLISGVPIGAVFVFLSAGPATNSVTMSIVKDMFGKRAFFIYIFSIAIWSIFFGYLLDSISSNIEVLKLLSMHSSFSILNYTATFIMLTLILYYIIKNSSS